MTSTAILTRLPAADALRPLALYTYLQLLDLLTTLAFLLGGVEEGNPLVRWAMHTAPHPLAGLIVVKAAAMAIGGYCWFSGRTRVLRRANVFFSLLVAWNLVCLILGLAFPGR